MTYKILLCGGEIKNMENSFKLKIPTSVNGTINCIWTLKSSPGEILTVNYKMLHI